MGGATNRFFSLLSSSTITTPTSTSAAAAVTFPLLHNCRRFSSVLLLHGRLKPSSLQPSSRLLRFSPTVKPARRRQSRFHSHATPPLHDHHFPSSSLPSLCPEWSDLLRALSAAGYFGRSPGFSAGDELSSALHLPDDFARAVTACLEFARDRAGLVRLLSRRDVEVVIRNGTPFLFRDADDSVAKLRALLFNGESNGLDIDSVSTVDLMRLLLGYASNLVLPSESNNSLYNTELVESSVRNLLRELAKLCYVVPDSNSFGSVQNQLVDRNKEPARPFGQKIEMKRGDWICPRCSFMNFARNLKCLECEEARPKRQLTGGEWECPQCDFFNYGRNMVCLRCDCKRPGEVSISTPSTGSAGRYENGSNSNKVDIDSRLAANEEKAQRWFSKISQLDDTSDMSSAIADDDFPEIMPLRKGVNRFVVSTRKTPLERRLANSQYQTKLDGQQFGQPGGRNSNYVPFVPLPPDMFAKKPENSETENGGKALSRRHESAASNTRESADNAAGSHKSEELVPKQLNEAERNKRKEQDEKSERWFKKVAELHNVSDLASAISDEDFPEIMPMYKGENRFVVSKKKDRSLNSLAYKRQMAMEQASDAKFVPFVPFPPDYFAKKDKPQADGTELVNKDAAETTPSSQTVGKLPEGSDNARPQELNEDHVWRTQDCVGLESWHSVPSGDNLSEKETRATYSPPASRNFSQSFAKSHSSSDDSLDGGISQRETPNSKSDLAGSSLQQSENQNTRGGWTGKSLEASAVKEPDPLDMSEEAKAERWFRRVAQIKDISELSQIPDEDFPSIMPMRKGVNRFVVSKRKTPLERRLTSPQYRRNLPTVSSDPVKKDTGSS